MLRFATKCCTARLMNRLRWPGLAIRSMVRSVVSGRTMLMRLLMRMSLNDLIRIVYTIDVYVKRRL